MHVLLSMGRVVTPSPALLSKLPAFSTCQSRGITPGRYKRTRRQSKAVGSTGVDSGQLLEVIKAFEPESCSGPPVVSHPSPLPPSPPSGLAEEGSTLI